MFPIAVSAKGRMAFCEMEAEDSKAVIQKLKDARVRLKKTNALNRTTAVVRFFSQTGSQHRRETVPD
jgi:hypothetical protein